MQTTRFFGKGIQPLAAWIAPVAITAALSSWSRGARADDAAPPPTLSTRAQLDEEARELKARIEVERLRAQLTLTKREADRIQSERPETNAPRSPDRASVLLPDLFGVTAVTGVSAGTGTLVGLSAGPLSYGTFHDARSDATAWTLAPAADVVVARRFTVGGSVVFSRQTSRSNDGSTADGYSLALGPRGGVLIPLGGGLTLWPELGLTVGASRNEATYSAFANARSLSRAMTPSAALSLVIPVTRHLFAAVGTDVAAAFALGEGDATDAQSIRVGSHLRLGLAL